LKYIFEKYDENSTSDDYETVHKGWPTDVRNLPYFYSQMAMYPKLAANVWRAISNLVVDKVEVKVVKCYNMRITKEKYEIRVNVIYGDKNEKIEIGKEVQFESSKEEKIIFECWDVVNDEFLGEAEVELWEILDEGLLQNKHLTLNSSQSNDPKKKIQNDFGREIHVGIRKISHKAVESAEAKRDKPKKEKKEKKDKSEKTSSSKIPTLSPITTKRSDDKSPRQETKSPRKEIKSPRKEIKSQEIKSPREEIKSQEIKSSREEIKSSREEIKSQEIKSPRREIKSLREGIKALREEIKSPREENKSPREEIKSSRQEIKSPREEKKEEGKESGRIPRKSKREAVKTKEDKKKH